MTEFRLKKAMYTVKKRQYRTKKILKNDAIIYLFLYKVSNIIKLLLIIFKDTIIFIIVHFHYIILYRVRIEL